MQKVALIVEDKDYILAIIETYLSKDFKCITAQTGRKALSQDVKPDVAVVSTNIKGEVTGVELFQQIKKKYGIPVLMITSNTTSLIRIDLLRKGADDVVTKPFNPEELQLRVKRLVK